MPPPVPHRFPLTYDAWLGVGRHSPTNLFSNIGGRQIVISALHFQHPFAQSDHVAWDYVAGVAPGVWVSASPAPVAKEPPCGRFETCYLVTENQRAVYGFGGSPAGLQLRLEPGSRIQPFLSLDAGALWFDREMPANFADRFNFMLGAGGGVLLARPEKLGVVVGYKLVHISNGGLAPLNPGLDNNVFYIGLVRVPSLTARRGEAARDVPRSETSVVGSARLGFTGDALLGHYGTTWSFAGSYLPFVSEHWQIGITPWYEGGDFRGQIVQSGLLAGTANLMTSGDRWRAYVGTLLGEENGTRQHGRMRLGAQLGALAFLDRTAALRGELRWRRTTDGGYDVMADALLTIDSYVNGRAALPALAPELGVVDVSGLAYAAFRFERERRIDLRIAPYLASWMQVGGELNRQSFMYSNGRRMPGGVENVFARAYVPVSLATAPFAHVFVERAIGLAREGNQQITSYGALGGVRHYINRGAALDVGLKWRRYTEVADIYGRSRRPDQTTLQARIVTQLRFGPARR